MRRPLLGILTLCTLLTLHTSCFAEPDFRFYYGAAWRGRPTDNAAYARQMGYSHIVVVSPKTYTKLPEAAGLMFLLESPEYLVMRARTLNLKTTYSQADKGWFEKFAAWKSTDPFPNNIATGWWFNNDSFSIQYDLQQQAIIDLVIDQIIALAKASENKETGFKFGGYWWDVPELVGDFWGAFEGKNRKMVNFTFWTGTESCALHPGITHEYATYSEGRAAFYKQLYRRTRQEFPNAKFIMEPYHPAEWIKSLEKRDDRRELMPDMLVEEAYGTDFVDDEKIFASGLITKTFMGSTQCNHEGDYENRLVAAKAAINGAWYNWSGRFGGTGNMPEYKNIFDVPARLQLIRLIPGWDNLAKVPLDQRSWNGDVYRSPNSFAGPDIIYSRHPGTKRLYAVFLNSRGKIALRPGEKVVKIYRANGMFAEAEDGKGDLKLTGSEIMLKRVFNTNKGYILELSSLRKDPAK